MFIPNAAVNPPFPKQVYANPQQEQLFEQQAGELAAGYAHNFQPGQVNMLAPIPFCGQIPAPTAANWSGNFVNPPESTDLNPAYGTPKGSTVFSWIINAARALPITPSDAGA